MCVCVCVCVCVCEVVSSLFVAVTHINAKTQENERDMYFE